MNVLLALCFAGHPFHDRVSRWVAALMAEGPVHLLTCPITEFGVIRIGPNARYCPDVASAQRALDAVKKAHRVQFSFVADDLDAKALPKWARKPNLTTDGHLAELARRAGARFATLDEGIPGALLIPK